MALTSSHGHPPFWLEGLLIDCWHFNVRSLYLRIFNARVGREFVFYAWSAGTVTSRQFACEGVGGGGGGGEM